MKTAKDRVKKKGINKTLRRLEARIAAWNDIPHNKKPAYRCPGSRQKGR